MPDLLAYQFFLGETLVYQHSTYLVVDDADGQRFTGRAIYTMRQKVLQVREDSFEIEMTREMVESAGALAEQAPPPQVSRFKMNRSGQILEAGSAGKLVGFPDYPLSEGDIWALSVPGQPQFQFRLEKIVVDGLERLAHVVSEAVFEQKEKGETIATKIEALTIFSITTGRQRSSQTAITAQWPDGKVSRTATEVELTSRTLPGLSPPGGSPIPGR